MIEEELIIIFKKKQVQQSEKITKILNGHFQEIKSLAGEEFQTFEKKEDKISYPEKLSAHNNKLRQKLWIKKKSSSAAQNTLKKKSDQMNLLV